MMRVLLSLLLSVFVSAAWAQGTVNNTYENSAKNGAICFSQDGRNMFTVGTNTISNYSLESSMVIRKNKLKLNYATALQLSPDGKQLLASGSSKVLHLINTEDLSLNANVTLPSKVGRVHKSSFADDSTIIVLTDKNHLLSIRTNNGAPNWSVAITKELPLRAFAVSTSAGLIATGGGSKQLKLWSLKDGSLVHTFAKEEAWVRTVDFDFDGKLLAYGLDNGTVKVFETETFSPSFAYKNHDAWITQIQFTPSNKYLVTVAHDRTSVFYSLEEKKIAQTIDHLPQETSAFQISPDGKDVVYSSPHKKANTSYTVASLGIAPRYILRDGKDKLAPQIYISEPARIVENQVVVSKDLLQLKGSVVDESGVRTLKINGVDIPFKQNGNFTMYIPLTMGDNPVSIEATDLNGNTAYRKFKIIRKDLNGVAVDTSAAINYLLVIGIDQYKFWPVLNNAVSDSKMVGTTLLSNYTFDPEHATFLFDTAATKSNIDKALRKYIELCGPNDNLMIYYAGHGYFDDVLNEGYWVPFNAQLGDDSEYISNTRILKIINNIQSKHTFLVVDACFSGALFAERQRGYTDNVERYKSRWGLASGRLEKVSDGALGDHSPFAASFVECLKNLEGKEVSASEVAQFVKKKVSEETNQTPRGNPLKNVGDEGGEFIFHKKIN